MSKNFNQFSIKIVGPAGSGVKSTGQLLQRSLQHLGFYTLGYLGYPSLIRGGQNSYQIDFSQEKVLAPKSTSDILLALDFTALEKYIATLSLNGIAIIDKNQLQTDRHPSLKELQKQAVFDLIELPISQILAKNQLALIVQNSFLVGTVFELLHYSNQPVKTFLKKNFAKKGESTIQANLRAVELGVEATRQSRHDFSKQTKNSLNLLPSQPNNQREVETLMLTGNDAIALAFIKAGGQFYSAYPMTPSTNILHFLKQHGEKHGLVVRQASTEIEAVGVAVGASYAGARSMVATSGGGLDLMTEFISMTATTETPLVIVDAQRTGSGTGLPTWTEQADFNIAKYGGHGEFPRVVIAPGTPLEAYKLLQEALNLADEYQIPVIFLSDKYLSETVFTLDVKVVDQVDVPINRGQLIINKVKQENYLRYKLTTDGISPRTIPGVVNGLHVANSDEHDEYGSSIESEPMRIKMQAKRLKKLETLRKKLPLPKILGNKQAKIALVGWGSTKGVLEAVVKKINQQAKTDSKQSSSSSTLALVHFTYMYPLDYTRLAKLFTNFDKIILVENNSTGQLKEDLLLAGANLTQMILKYDGEPFFVSELLEEIKHILLDERKK